jgi:hypothetical protein
MIATKLGTGVMIGLMALDIAAGWIVQRMDPKPTPDVATVERVK